ncbi:hypothetical protein AB0L70_02255 [Kribbella sp. NPDC051952]|uniref:hypothetical protein n=1 Tax=Kribbella sp. NPDC051952 TaxID=3154851 RepID=UPI0034489E38
MPDTDDDPNVALELDQYEQGEDDTESASERRARALRRQPDERLAAVTGLTREEDEARRQAELDAAHATERELSAEDERELEEQRLRHETLDATAAATEAREAFRLADLDDATSDRHRELADTERLHSVSDQARGGHKLDEAAARPDEPGAAGLAASGRRDQRAAAREGRVATEEDLIADDYAGRARERRTEGQQAQEAQPPATATAPQKPPVARKFVRKELRKRRTPDRSTEPDLGLGD